MPPGETDWPQADFPVPPWFPAEPASFLIRAAAFAVDLVIAHLAYFCCFVAALVLGWPENSRSWSSPGLPLPMVFLLFGAGFPFFTAAYFWALHAWQGQTVGKMIFGIKVVTVDGELPPPGQVFLRCIGYGVSLLPCGLGFFWAAVDRKNRCLHDHLAVTWVITNSTHSGGGPP